MASTRRIGLQECVVGVPSWNRVNRRNFGTGKRYYLLSADGGQMLTASDVKSTRAGKMWQHLAAGVASTLNFPPPFHSQGYSMRFQSPEVEPPTTRAFWPAPTVNSFTFTGRPGKYRMHCSKYGDNMMFFLGTSGPREWVVRNKVVSSNGTLEVLDIEWLGEDCAEKFKIRGNRDQYVMWEFPGFIASSMDDATEFILGEI